MVLLIIFLSPGIFSNRLYSAADTLQQESPFRLQDVSPEYEPQNRLSGDAAIMFEPWRELLRRSIAGDDNLSGYDQPAELPLWNPHQGNGTPHLANSQSALLYPLTWLAAFLGPKWGIILSYLIKLFVGGFFAYLFLRQLGVRFWIALVAGATSMLGGATTVWLLWPITDALVFFPVLLYLVDRVHQKPSRWNHVWFALVIALTIFSGHIQTAVHAFLLVAAYALFRLFTGPGPFKQRVFKTLILAAAGVLGLILAAVHLVPFAEYLQASTMWRFRSGVLENPFVQPVRLLGLLLWPDLLGNPAWAHAPYSFETVKTIYNDSMAGYVGVTAWLAAVVGMWYAWRNKAAWFFVGVAAFTLLMAYRWPAAFFDAVTAVPGLRTINHIRLLMFFGFALVVIAALGLNAALDRRQVLARRYIGVLIAAGIALMLGCITLFTQVELLTHIDPEQLTEYLGYLRGLVPWYAAELVVGTIITLLLFRAVWPRFFNLNGRIWTGIIGGLAAVVILLPNFFHGMTYQPLIEPRLFYQESQLVQFLRDHPTIERTISLSRVAHIWPNLATRFGFYDSRVYDSVMLDASHRALYRNAQIVGNTVAIQQANHNYLNAVGTRYLIAVDRAELQSVLNITSEEAEQLYPIAADMGDYKIFENTRVWPRAFLTSSPDFFKYPDRVDLATPVTIESYSNNSVSLLVQATADSYLVLSDSYFPGWTAHVDGVQAAVQQADLNFRAVHLTPGPHRVVFTYQPKTFYYGAVISLVGLGSVVVIGLVPPLAGLLKKRRPVAN